MTTQVFRGITYTVQTATGDNQTLQGTSAPDWLVALGGNNIINSWQGNDVILAGVEFVAIATVPEYGGQGITINALATAGNNTIHGGTGNDYVVTGPGNDTVYLGNGNNIFDGTLGGNDRIFAGDGNDIIDISGPGNHQVDADGGNNRIYLGPGNDSVLAGSGNDVITTVGSGLGSLLTYALDNAGAPYTQSINAGSGNNQIEVPVFGQTKITTGSGNDFVLAFSLNTALGGAINSDSVTILTGGGKDTVVTIDTKSLIKTSGGNDTIYAGADTIYAGGGHNMINLRGAMVPIPSPTSDLGFPGASLSYSRFTIRMLIISYDKCMEHPTVAQLRSLYRLCHLLTNLVFQPIYIVRLDERTNNLFILAGYGEEIELEIQSDGMIVP